MSSRGVPFDYAQGRLRTTWSLDAHAQAHLETVAYDLLVPREIATSAAVVRSAEVDGLAMTYYV